jgi:hypothetical protein
MRLRRTGSGKLSLHQRMLLLHGFDIFAGGRLVNVSDRRAVKRAADDWAGYPGGERAAWIAHRAELMGAADLPPATFPYAFWKYDAPDAPEDFIGRIRWLQERNLIDEADLIAVERYCLTCNPEQSQNFCSAFDTEDSIRQQQLSYTLLRFTLAEFEGTAAWHEFRGRAELAEVYQRRAEACRAVLANATGFEVTA